MGNLSLTVDWGASVQKEFRKRHIDGNFSLYYPASNHDVYKFKELKEESKLDLKAKDHLRLKRLSERKPSGKYALYYHQEIGNI